MSSGRQRGAGWLSLVVFTTLAFLAGIDSGTTQTGLPNETDVSTNTPPPPQMTSPVAYFRELLVMSDEELVDAMQSRPPVVRRKLYAKIAEYKSIPADQRELRLRATELRFYLMPLLSAPATNRAAQLAMVPAEHRELIRSRLQQWDILPPQIKEEFLENEAAVRLFSRLLPQTPANADELVAGLNAEQRKKFGQEIARWQALSPQQQQQLIARFRGFFELTPGEKSRALRSLSVEDRSAMEKTLQTFDELPAAKREYCVQAFQRFAAMTPKERAQFLRNAEHWARMTPAERQEWRQLVTQLSRMAPLPQGVEPLLPPLLAPLPIGAGGAPPTAQTD